MSDRTATAPLWERLDTALRRSARPVAGSLRPPLASDDEHAAWIRSPPLGALGITAAYCAHDGASRAGGVLSRLPAPPGATWTRTATWLPVVRAREERALLMAILDRGRADDLFPIGRVGHYSLAAVREGEDQRCVCVDIATGELVAFVYTDGLLLGSTPLGVTWTGYLEGLLAELERGALEAGQDQFGTLRLEERHIPLPAAPAPRDDAATLLQMLRERRLVELRGEPSKAWMAALGKALRKRSAIARLAAVKAALESDEVDEHFAGDDELEALVALVRGD